MKCPDPKPLVEPFLPGSWVLHGRSICRYLDSTPAGLARIARPTFAEPLEVEIQSLRPLLASTTLERRLMPFASYPIACQEEALRRRQVITSLLVSKWTTDAVQKSAEEIGVSVTTLNRYIDRYVISGCRVEALIPKVLRFGVANHELPDRSEEVIQEGISIYYLDTGRIPIRGVIGAIQRKCKELHTSIPCAATIRKRIQNVAPDEATLQRVSVKAAREIFAPLSGNAPEGDRPLAMVEIDHTPLNVLCRLADGSTRRPWITMAIDAFTRMVLGFYISFEAPSRLSVGMCLYRVLTRKEEWLRSNGITTPWPCFGKPILIQTDNAKEFRSYDMDRICLELNIVLQWRPVGLPEYGGRIERLMGAAAFATEFLPGKTFRCVTERKEYPSEELAVMDLPTLERALLHFVVEIYHHQGHRGLRNRSPIHEWREAETETLGADKPTSMTNSHQMLSLLPTFTRTIQQKGVSWEGIRYFDPILIRHIRRPDPESSDGHYRFAFDPRDIRFVYWREPHKQLWHRIQSRDLGMQSMTLWERDGLIEADIAAAKKTIDGEIVSRGEAALLKIADDQKRLSLATHKERKRVSKGRKTQVSRAELPALNTASDVPTLGFAGLSKRTNFIPDNPDPAMWEDIPDFSAGDL